MMVDYPVSHVRLIVRLGAKVTNEIHPSSSKLYMRGISMYEYLQMIGYMNLPSPFYPFSPVDLHVRFLLTYW